MDIEATTARDGSAIVTIDGTPQKITATTLEDARAQVVAIAQERAATAGESATLTASDPDGVWTVIVTPDGQRWAGHRPDRITDAARVPA